MTSKQSFSSSFRALLGLLLAAAWPGTASAQFDPLASFSGNYGTPQAGPTLVQGADGPFYGTTQYGGSLAKGTVFRLNPDWTITTLHSFGTSADAGAEQPTGALVRVGGDFFGTTKLGGLHGRGTVFRVTPQGTVTILHSFAYNGRDGREPQAGLTVGNDGSLYGTTR